MPYTVRIDLKDGTRIDRHAWTRDEALTMLNNFSHQGYYLNSDGFNGPRQPVERILVYTDDGVLYGSYNAGITLDKKG